MSEARPENNKSVDQRRLAIDQFLAKHVQQLARQGAVVATWRRRDRRRAGPYHLLVCRDSNGRQRSVYLGADKALVSQTRECLSELQAQHRQQCCLRRVRRQVRRELADSRVGLDLELAKVGLVRKGAEVRGWLRLANRKRLSAVNVAATEASTSSSPREFCGGASTARSAGELERIDADAMDRGPALPAHLWQR